MLESLEIALILSIFVVVFPIFWMFIIWIIGRFAGWHRLARRFATDRTLTGDDFRWKSLSFGYASRYSNSINITVSFEGIYLRPIFFFRAGHKPLLIPWDAINSIESGMFSSVTLNVMAHDSSKLTRVTFYGKAVVESVNRNLPIRLDHGDEFA